MQGRIEKIVLILGHDVDRPMERWIFGFQEDKKRLHENVNLSEIESYFRALMRKINVVDASLKPLVVDGKLSDSRFSVH